MRYTSGMHACRHTESCTDAPHTGARHRPVAPHAIFSSVTKPTAPKAPAAKPRRLAGPLAKAICGHRAQATAMMDAPTTTAVALDTQSLGSYGSCRKHGHVGIRVHVVAVAACGDAM
jgi:hypothetical protein